MEITYIAHACFEVKTKDLVMIFDPFDASIGYKPPKLSADILLLSHDHYDHANKEAVSGYRLLIDGPGEYEIAGVSIQGLQTYHDDKEGVERGKNTIYVVEADGFSLLHLGDLGHELSKDTLEKIPEIDILMIPVGGTYTIDAEVASKVISSIEPGMVIPMHYQTKELTLGTELDKVEKFLNEMGVESPKKEKKLKVTKKADVPDETEIIVLSPTAQ